VEIYLHAPIRHVVLNSAYGRLYISLMVVGGGGGQRLGKEPVPVSPTDRDGRNPGTNYEKQHASNVATARLFDNKCLNKCVNK